MNNFENNRDDNDEMYQLEFDYLYGTKMFYLWYCSSTTVFFFLFFIQYMFDENNLIVIFFKRLIPVSNRQMHQISMKEKKSIK